MECTDMERRILDMWPKFEDGKYVMYEDKFDFNGEVKTAHGFNFGIGGRVSICSDKGLHVRLPNGERVKRPAPKVLDADDVEIRVGDTVWLTDGRGPWSVSRTVYANRLRVICDDEKNGHLNAYPETLTHRAPVLAADGRALREGETVWDGKGNGPYVIKKIEDDGIVRIGLNDLDYFASELFSERPDSWERLEEDARQLDINLNDTTDDYPRMSCCRDLIRRAKALAEKEAAR